MEAIAPAVVHSESPRPLVGYSTPVQMDTIRMVTLTVSTVPKTPAAEKQEKQQKDKKKFCCCCFF
jgi:hypothetical protein